MAIKDSGPSSNFGENMTFKKSPTKTNSAGKPKPMTFAERKKLFLEQKKWDEFIQSEREKDVKEYFKQVLVKPPAKVKTPAKLRELAMGYFVYQEANGRDITLAGLHRSVGGVDKFEGYKKNKKLAQTAFQLEAFILEHLQETLGSRKYATAGKIFTLKNLFGWTADEKEKANTNNLLINKLALVFQNISNSKGPKIKEANAFYPKITAKKSGKVVEIVKDEAAEQQTVHKG